MSYEKTTWATGDVVTAEKLNNLEDGVAGAESIFELIELVYGTEQEGPYISSCSATYSEIAAMFEAGKLVIARLTPVDSDNNNSVESCFLSKAYFDLDGVSILFTVPSFFSGRYSAAVSSDNTWGVWALNN